MIWSLAGLVLAFGIAVAALYRSRARGGFYDTQVYGMTSASHRRYALVSLAFAAYFVCTVAWHLETAGIAGLALYALIAVFYATSFLRGFADDDQ
jgi:hypothetical protein